MPSHTTVWNAPIHGKATHNSWYDTRRHLQWEVTRGIYTHKQARVAFQCLVWKKISYLARFDAEMYCLFLGRECKRAQNIFNGRQPSTQYTGFFRSRGENVDFVEFILQCTWIFYYLYWLSFHLLKCCLNFVDACLCKVSLLGTWEHAFGFFIHNHSLWLYHCLPFSSTWCFAPM